jgi:hypothetical protein
MTEYRKRPEILARRNELQKAWARNNIESVLLTHARKRAKDLGLDCTITKEDIIVPEFCPALGIPLFYSDDRASENSPSIDRFDLSKGYVKDNIHVISHKANRVKNNATPDEFLRIAEWIKQCQRIKSS